MMKFSKYFKYFLVGTILCIVILRFMDKPNPGIIAFEFAKTLDNANNMIAIWADAGAENRKIAGNFFDYIFMLCYGGSLFLFYKAWYNYKPQIIFKVLMYFALLAPLLDAVENYGLLKLQFKTGTDFHAQLAYYCASTKFILLIPCILGLLYWIVLRLMKKI